MNQKLPNSFYISDSPVGCLLALLLLGLVLGSVGLGFVFKGFLILIALLVILPPLGFLAFRWWLRSKLIEDQCPVCSYEFTGFKNVECQCPNCGEILIVESGRFVRLTPPGTIDVEVVDTE